MAGGQRRRDEIDDDDCADVLGIDVRGPDADPFDIPAKRAPVERLRRWRQAALVLNASRRFRYTLDLKKEEEKEQIRRKIRAHAALAIMACTAMILIGGDIDTNVTCHECHVHVQYI
ncbi:unnamed protein product [Miscanthus lutarioriparius]|uniref:Calcium-transporting P-type ATPase N-terminal autoinhibitory domain-containing protein n=1 Tax=Miscanthus lutarioriparius TaxID=422564 RepID=A0A811Q6S6_9POAL|nr:unnamed protein product [Miscanthus lutarioriparius]